MKAICWIGTLLTLVVCTAVPANVIRVPEDVLTIQHAIDAASAGDTIDVAPGVWREAIDLRGKSILLKGRDGAESTVIDATDRRASVVTCVSAEGPGTVLQDLTLTGGTGYEGLAGRRSAVGGGLIAIGSSPTFRRCIFKGNTVTGNGGGAYCGRGGNVRFEGCAFIANAGEKGGGLLVVGSRPVADACTFEKNEARYSGGGVYAAREGAPVLRGSSFTANFAAYHGGGVCSSDSGGEVLDCDFVRNRAGSQGGALYLGFRTAMTASACTMQSPTDTVGGQQVVHRVDRSRGACDLGDQICIVAEQTDCEQAGGVYGGHGSSCVAKNPDAVARRSGDLDRDGEVNGRDLAIMMLLWR